MDIPQLNNDFRFRTLASQQKAAVQIIRLILGLKNVVYGGTQHFPAA
jgi:hypothetical protein